MSNDYHRETVKLRKPANDRRVFSKSLVAVEFHKVFKETLNKVQCIRTIRMTREQHTVESCLSIFSSFWLLRRLFFFFIFRHSTSSHPTVLSDLIRYLFHKQVAS